MARENMKYQIRSESTTNAPPQSNQIKLLQRQLDRVGLDSRLVNFDQMQLRSFILYVAGLTGRNFIHS